MENVLMAKNQGGMAGDPSNSIAELICHVKRIFKHSTG